MNITVQARLKTLSVIKEEVTVFHCAYMYQYNGQGDVARTFHRQVEHAKVM